jgi:predicted secreted protein
MGREVEHERVVDRLIDLQARLRGEPEPPEPITVTHDDLEVAVTPSRAEPAFAEPAFAEPVPHARQLGSPERLATILGQVDELRGDLTRVVEALDAATEELAPDRPFPAQHHAPQDRHRLRQRS